MYVYSSNTLERNFACWIFTLLTFEEERHSEVLHFPRGGPPFPIYTRVSHDCQSVSFPGLGHYRVVGYLLYGYGREATTHWNKGCHSRLLDHLPFPHQSQPQALDGVFRTVPVPPLAGLTVEGHPDCGETPGEAGDVHVGLGKPVRSRILPHGEVLSRDSLLPRPQGTELFAG